MKISESTLYSYVREETSNEFSSRLVKRKLLADIGSQFVTILDVFGYPEDYFQSSRGQEGEVGIQPENHHRSH